MATQLILIRHGITAWNKERRYCGHRDVNLSCQGKAQALRLERRLKAIRVDQVYSSDRKRALETGRIIFKRANIIKVGGLKEIDFGALEGLSYGEAMLRYGDAYKRWLADPYKNHIPRTEPMSVFKKRVEAAIKKIVRLNRGRNVAVVCHGGAIGVFISGILKSRDFWRYVPAAASISIVEYKLGKPVIKKFNDLRHLE